MERREYAQKFRRSAIFQAAKTNTPGNFLTLLGLWFVSPHDEMFVTVFTPFATFIGLLSVAIITLGAKFNSDSAEKTQAIFEKSYFYSTCLLTGSLGFFLVFQGWHFGFLSTAHLATWVFVMATLEACASYLFHIPKFFFITFLALLFPSFIWLLNIGTTTSYVISGIILVYCPIMLNRVNELTKLKNQTVDLLQLTQEREDQLQIFIDMLPSHILWIDSNFLFRGLNKKMEGLIGERKEILNKSLFDSNLNKVISSEIHSFFVSKQDQEMVELLISTSEGERWFMCSFSKYDFGSGNEVFVACVDIHEDKMIKEQVAKQRTLNEQAANLVNLGEMASGIAHEINNPIAIAQGTATILKHKIEKNEFDSDVILKKLDKMIESHERVTDVIKGMKSFSKSEVSEDRKNILLSDIIKSTLVLCSEKFKDHGIILDTSRVDTSVSYSCKKQDVSQVLLSFLNNSFDSVSKNSDELKKEIKIYTENSDSNLKICVSDTGGGIKDTKKIFVPFYSSKSPGKGVGLGLSLSQKIAHSYNGKIEAQSEDGVTTFKLALPITELRT